MNQALNSYLKKIQRIAGKKIFFIAGTEKSGTTWLQMMLDHHPQVVCKGEGQFGTKLWPVLRGALEDYSSFVSGLNQKVFNEIDHFPIFHERSIRAIQAFSALLLLSEYGDDPGILSIGEKTPGHLRTLVRLNVLFPDAKFIFIFRDGRDIAVSGWHHLKRQYGESGEKIDDYARRIAKVWKSDYEKVLSFAEQQPESCTFVRYEDLHRCPAPEISRLLSFLGLDSSSEIVAECIDACSFSKLTGGRNRGEESQNSHFRKGIVGDWTNYFDQKAWEVFNQEAGDLLIKLGYSNDWCNKDATLKALTNVVSKTGVPGSNTNNFNFNHSMPFRRSANVDSLEKWRESIKRCETEITNGRASFDNWYQLGEALRITKDAKRAAESYASALTFKPKDQDAQLMFAVAIKEAEQNEDAVSAYQQLLTDHPGFAMGWSLFGMLLKELKRYSEAIEAFRISLTIRDDIPTHNVLVMTLEEGGFRLEAIEAGTKLLELKDRVVAAEFNKSPYKAISIDVPIKTFNYSEPWRNIIAFSLWGDNPTYVHGAIVNARIAPNLYYGWRTRFYCDYSVPNDAIEELKRCGAEVILINDPALLSIRPLWRFLVADDPNVDWFVCRDADSRLNAQELLAVEAWLKSGKAFHVMRDHVFHMELMLAGMWGGMAGVLPNLKDMILGQYQYFNSRFGDQAFLSERVWPLIKEHVLIHDSYYRVDGSQDFPLGYRLPGSIHVGGAIKNMPTWRY